MESKDITIENISVGDSVSFERSWTEKDVLDFALLSGDYNPLHTDENYAAETQFKKRVVHGFLVGSSISCLIGMYLPGKRSLYLSQSLLFKKPVFIGDEVVVSGKVLNISLSTRIIEMEIKITKNMEEVLDGVAKVQILV